MMSSDALSPPVRKKGGGVIEDSHCTSQLRIRPVTTAPQRDRANPGSACGFNVIWRIPDHHGVRFERARPCPGRRHDIGVGLGVISIILRSSPRYEVGNARTVEE